MLVVLGDRCRRRTAGALRSARPSRHSVPRGDGEISTIDHYGLTATWATGADRAGFTGLKYLPRFSTGHDAALAVFGDAGAHVPAGFSVTSVSSLAHVLAREGIGPRFLPTAHEAVDDDVDDLDVR